MSEPIRFERAHVSGVTSDHAKTVHKISLMVPFGLAEDAIKELKQLAKLGELKSNEASNVRLEITPLESQLPLKKLPMEEAFENITTAVAKEVNSGALDTDEAHVIATVSGGESE